MLDIVGIIQLESIAAVGLLVRKDDSEWLLKCWITADHDRVKQSSEINHHTKGAMHILIP